MAAMDYTEAQEFAQGLRDLADFIENNEGAGLSSYTKIEVCIHPDDAPDMAVRAKTLGGEWQKEVNDYSFSLVQRFGDFVSVEMTLGRGDVCKARVVGTKEVQKPIYEHTTRYETVTEDIVEYDCPKSLLKFADA
jgi:hypothetical protein